MSKSAQQWRHNSWMRNVQTENSAASDEAQVKRGRKLASKAASKTAAGGQRLASAAAKKIAAKVDGSEKDHPTFEDVQHVLVSALKLGGWLWQPLQADKGGALSILVATHPSSGKVVWLVLKNQDGKLTSTESAWISSLELGGQRVVVVRPDSADKLVVDLISDVQEQASD